MQATQPAKLQIVVNASFGHMQLAQVKYSILAHVTPGRKIEGTALFSIGSLKNYKEAKQFGITLNNGRYLY